MKRVSVVILNWNSKEFLEDCIDSVLAQDYPAVELVVMDNASADGSVAWLRDKFPDVAIIENEVNLGFARAHNKGIDLTSGDYYVPLNPDIVLVPNFLSAMVEAAESDPQAGSVSGKVLFMAEQNTNPHLIYTAGHLLTKNRKPSNRGYKRVDEGQYDKIEYVFGANGACPLYKRDMLQSIKVEGDYFDSEFFLYGDDYDLGWRSQLMGWKCLYTPYAVAYHYGKGSGGLAQPHIQYQYARNRYIEILKNDFFAHLLLDLPYIVTYEVMWQGYTLLTNPQRFLANLAAYAGFLAKLPTTLRHRREIHRRRRVTKAYMRTFFVGMTLR